jgi:hypothetical protein
VPDSTRSQGAPCRLPDVRQPAPRFLPVHRRRRRRLQHGPLAVDESLLCHMARSRRQCRQRRCDAKAQRLASPELGIAGQGDREHASYCTGSKLEPKPERRLRRNPARGNVLDSPYAIGASCPRSDDGVRSRTHDDVTRILHSPLAATTGPSPGSVRIKPAIRRSCCAAEVARRGAVPGLCLRRERRAHASRGGSHPSLP